MMLLALTQSVSFGVYISVALLIAGLVCTARFIVSDHTQKEIYGGLAGRFRCLADCDFICLILRKERMKIKKSKKY